MKKINYLKITSEQHVTVFNSFKVYFFCYCKNISIYWLFV